MKKGSPVYFRIIPSTFTGNVTDEVPAFDDIRLSALQFDNALVRSLLKVLLLVKTLLRLLVE